MYIYIYIYIYSQYFIGSGNKHKDLCKPSPYDLLVFLVKYLK